MACFLRGSGLLEPCNTNPRAARLAGQAFPALIAMLALAGCERQAPGPEDCVAFAEAWLRTHPPANVLAADHAFDELVRRCLTEPYDRELVTCVVGNRQPERCRIDYARRVELRREERSR